MAISVVECPNPKCIEAKRKWKTHRVYDRGDHAVCESCGGVIRDGVLTKTCAVCKKQTDDLYGLFVPHRCKDCQEAERKKQEASNNRCLMCHQLYMNCCC
jgi:hypothetical protein